MNRALLLVGMAAAACGVVAFAALAVEREGASHPRSATVAALSFSYPERFQRQRFHSCSYAVTGVRGACESGIVVASYRLDREPEIGAPGAVFSRNGVAFELYRAPRQHPTVVAPAVRFPLSLADFHRVGRSIRRPSKSQQELFFRVDGANYWAVAWTGQAAKKVDRAALHSLVASVRIR